MKKIITRFFVVFSMLYRVPPLLAKVRSSVEQELVNSIELLGANVQQSKIWTTVNCKYIPIPECDNVPNPSLTYQMPLVPCSIEKGCSEANDKVLPFSDHSSAWHLDESEALVLIVNELPPSEIYWSFELEIYERHKDRIKNLDGYVGPKPGEILPPPIHPDRYVISGAVGESANQFNTKFGPIGKNGGKLGYVKIYTPNKNVASKITEELVKIGYPKRYINIYGLPKDYINENSKFADTYRIITRFGHVRSKKEMASWIKNNPIGIYRIKLNEQIKSRPYSMPKLHEAKTGTHELVGKEVEWKNYNDTLDKKFGKASTHIYPFARSYNTDFCVETGSYCWGYNRDALYMNINDPETNEMALFDLSSKDSKIVISTVDHTKTGFTTFWNFGIFAESGKLRGSVDFEVTKKLKETQGEFLWFQIKRKCQRSDVNCFEAGLKRGDGDKVQIVNRNYLNYKTATAPDASEFAFPEIRYYQ